MILVLTEIKVTITLKFPFTPNSKEALIKWYVCGCQWHWVFLHVIFLMIYTDCQQLNIMSERQCAGTKSWVSTRFPHEKVYNLEVCGLSFMKHSACIHIFMLLPIVILIYRDTKKSIFIFEEIILYYYVTVPVSMSAKPNAHYYHHVSWMCMPCVLFIFVAKCVWCLRL